MKPCTYRSVCCVPGREDGMVVGASGALHHDSWLEPEQALSGRPPGLRCSLPLPPHSWRLGHLDFSGNRLPPSLSRVHSRAPTPAQASPSTPKQAHASACKHDEARASTRASLVAGTRGLASALAHAGVYPPRKGRGGCLLGSSAAYPPHARGALAVMVVEEATCSASPRYP